jgi:vacuolar protein sorting-associated protein 51
MGKPLPAVVDSSSDSNSNKRLVPNRNATKARDLLRQHYGMGVGPPTPVPGRPDDPMDIGQSFVFRI